MATTGWGSPSKLALAWLVIGVAMVVVPVWVAWTRWSSVLTGHPVLLAIGTGSVLTGAVALAWALATLFLGDRPGGTIGSSAGTTRQQIRRERRRTALGVALLVPCLVLVVVLAWARPLPPAPVALAAMRSEGDVRVLNRLTWYELTSAARDANGDLVRPTTGLVFVPGARVDSRAYAAVLRPLAARGFLVAVLKEPLGIGLLDADHAGRVMRVHPEIGRWVVGGHSLGGVGAAAFADSHPVVGDAPVAGLLLYAAYPADRLRRDDLRVTSVSGDRDRLTTPQDVAEAKGDLPPTTAYVVVPGAVHSFFGDYGDQRGDGIPATDRASAQAAIIKATADLLVAVTPKPRR